MKLAERNLMIDVIRGIAIFMVLCTHLGAPSWLTDHLTEPTLLFLSHGYYGVVIFFVISGFLITTHLIQRYGETSKTNLLSFYIMRIGRIIPGLILLLTMLIILDKSNIKGFIFPEDLSVWQAASNALTFQYNYFYISHNIPETYAWAPLWSLSLEEIFYLIFPLICIILRKRTILMIVLAIIIVTGPLRRIDGKSLYLASGCFDLMAIGVMTALLTHNKKLQDWLSDKAFIALCNIIVGTGIIICTVMYTHVEYNRAVGPSLCGLGTAIYLFGTAYYPIGYNKFKSGIVFILIPLMIFGIIGQLSYEIYLFHMPLHVLFDSHLPEYSNQTYVFATIFIVALIVAKFYTEPANQFIRNAYHRWHFKKS